MKPVNNILNFFTTFDWTTDGLQRDDMFNVL